MKNRDEMRCFMSSCQVTSWRRCVTSDSCLSDNSSNRCSRYSNARRSTSSTFSYSSYLWHSLKKYCFGSQVGRIVNVSQTGEKIMGDTIQRSIHEILDASSEVSPYLHEQTRKRWMTVDAISITITINFSTSVSADLHSLENQYVQYGICIGVCGLSVYVMMLVGILVE